MAERWQPRLVALDIDGTLLRWVEESGTVHGEVVPTVRDAVRRAYDAGAHIVLASGRSLHGMTPIADQLGLPDQGADRLWIVASNGAVVLRYPDAEHRYERRIQGGSMLFAGDIARDVRFSDIPRAVDSDILDRSMAAGVRVYSGDRHNYVSVRGDDRHSHTWTVTDSTFLTSTGRLLFYGDPTTHVSI